MPSFNTFKSFHNSNSIGEQHKADSDMIMEATWDADIATQTAYFYDYFHDNEPLKITNIHPENNKNAVPISIKYLANSSQSMDKDQVTYHLQFKPSFEYTLESNLNYYDKDFGIYDAIFPIGLYVAIKDNKGRYNKWIVVALANYYDAQFSTYEILPCNYIFQYIFENTKYQIAGILRTQSSYTSGVWRDNMMQTTDDVNKFLVPLNKFTELLFYDQRMIIDAKVKTEPRTWQISKVDRTNPNGICVVTLKQSEFNKNKDYIEYDENNNVIGQWADFYSSAIEPQSYEEESIIPITNYSKITYSGVKPELKIGGNNKKFTVTFYNSNNEEIPYINGIWSVNSDYTYEDESTHITHLLSEYLVITTNVENPKLAENQIQIKIIKPLNDQIPNMWIGKTCVIKHDTGTISSSIEINIVGL